VPASEIEKITADVLRHRYPAATDNADRQLIEQYLARIEVRKGILQIDLAPRSADPWQTEAKETMSIPWSPPSPVRKREILLPAGADPEMIKPMKSENRARLLRAIRSGSVWLSELVDQRIADTEALAQREGWSERKIGMTLSLAFLAPDIIAAALDGQLPRGLGLTRLTELPASWAQQRRIVGLSRA
jgi:site-specific DNA recombinase